EAATDRETARFPAPPQGSYILRRDSAMPSHWIAVAVLADHRKVRITIGGHSQLRRSARAPAATACKHRGNRSVLKNDHQAARRLGCEHRGTLRVGRFMQELTMREVAEIKI